MERNSLKMRASMMNLVAAVPVVLHAASEDEE
jgi:hypothetical protein